MLSPAALAHLLRVFLIGLLVLLPLDIRAARQPEVVRVLSEDEAFRADAERYASMVGVSVDEAEMRLRVQIESTAAREQIAELAGARFAGSWIEHSPEFRVVIAVTGDQPLAGVVEPLADPSGRNRLEIAYGASYSLDALETALASLRTTFATGELLSEGTPALGLRLRENSIVVYTLRSLDEDQRHTIETAALAPVIFDVLDGPSVDHSTRGGRKLQPPGCTTGFTARNGNGVRGVLTAGHCDLPSQGDPVYWFSNYIYYDLNWIAIFNDADEDWAYMRQPAGSDPLYDVPKMFWDGYGWRTVTEGDAPGQAMMEGDFVCHYGFGSDLDGIPQPCGYVTDAWWAPEGNGCNGGPCNEAFAFVRDPTGPPDLNTYCTDKDSGGPWFAVTRAYGIHKGGNVFTHETCYFTRTQKIDNHGFNILEE